MEGKLHPGPIEQGRGRQGLRGTPKSRQTFWGPQESPKAFGGPRREGAPFVSIVVPAYNAAQSLPACLEALSQQSAPPSTYEVLVVDDGSTDATSSVARRYGVRLLNQAHQGAAAARNYGLREAKGELILFTDADCAPRPDWVKVMRVAFLADPQLAGAKGVYRSRQMELMARFVQLEYEERYRRMESRATIDFIDTYCAAYRRRVLLEAGGFDTSFPGASVEDQELSFRLAERGYKLAFLPQAVVYHRHPTSLRTYLRRKARIGYWKVLVHLKHPGKALTDSHTPMSLKLQVALWLLIVVGLAVWPFGREARAMAAVASALFVASLLPFTINALKQDLAVGLLSPLLLALRAAALDLGLAAGALALAPQWVKGWASRRTVRGQGGVIVERETEDG